MKPKINNYDIKALGIAYFGVMTLTLLMFLDFMTGKSYGYHYFSSVVLIFVPTIAIKLIMEAKHYAKRN